MGTGGWERTWQDLDLTFPFKGQPVTPEHHPCVKDLCLKNVASEAASIFMELIIYQGGQISNTKQVGPTTWYDSECSVLCQNLAVGPGSVQGISKVSGRK